MPAAQEPDPVTEPAGLLRFRLRRFLPLAAIATAVTVVYAMGWHRALSLETLVGNRAAIDAFMAGHGALAVLVYVGLYAAATAGALPAGAALAVAGGFLFGTLVGGLGAMLGSTIGAITLYLIAPRAFGEPMVRRAGPRLQAFVAGFRAGAFSYVVFLLLVPSP